MSKNQKKRAHGEGWFWKQERFQECGRRGSIVKEMNDNRERYKADRARDRQNGII